MSERTPGLVRVAFRRLGLTATSGGGGANANAFYLVTRAANAPTNAVNLGLLTSGVLQQTVVAGVATVVATFMPAGRVPAGDASGSGILSSTDALFYYEATARPRFNVNQSSAWADETNVGAGILINTPAGVAQASILQLQGNDDSFVRAYQTSDGLVIGNIHFQDGADGITSGSVQINARQSTSGGGALIESSRHSAGGVLIPKVLAVGPAGVGQTFGGAQIWMQNNGTVNNAPSGTVSIKYSAGGVQWPQFSSNTGNFADMARAGQGADIVSGSTTTLGTDGLYFRVTGGSTINFLSTGGLRPGHVLELFFVSATPLTNAAASPPGGTAALNLDGGVSVTMPAGSRMLLLFDATAAVYLELGRSGTGVGGFLGTQGSVVFVGATGGLAQDNGNFFFDDATNRLYVGANPSGAGAGGAVFLNTNSAGILPAENLITVTSTSTRDKYYFSIGGGPTIGDATARVWWHMQPATTQVAASTTGTSWLTMRIQQQTFNLASGSATIVTGATVWIDGPPVFTGSFGTGYTNEAFHVDSGISTFKGMLTVKDGTGANILFVDGPNQRLGFFAGGNVVQQTSGANLTNNVTSGGVNDTIADFTNLTTYATDAPTIRNDIFQLARTLKHVNDGMRAYGLLT